MKTTYFRNLQLLIGIQYINTERKIIKYDNFISNKVYLKKEIQIYLAKYLLEKIKYKGKLF